MLSMNQFGQNSLFFFIFYFSPIFSFGMELKRRPLGIRNSSKFSYLIQAPVVRGMGFHIQYHFTGM